MAKLHACLTSSVFHIFHQLILYCPIINTCSTMSSLNYIFYQLVDLDCKPYHDIPTDAMDRIMHLTVDQFCVALEWHFANTCIKRILRSIELNVFGNKSALREWQPPLERSAL